MHAYDARADDQREPWRSSGVVSGTPPTTVLARFPGLRPRHRATREQRDAGPRSLRRKLRVADRAEAIVAARRAGHGTTER